MGLIATVYAASPLAGRYHGRGLEERTILNHAVSDSNVHEGKLKRLAGEAFCNRKIELVDFYGYESAERIDCPKCLEILQRVKAK